MANSKDLELKLNDSSQVIRDSYTVKLAEKDQVSLNITGDVAGQVAYAPKGNDIVVTVYNKQEHEDATEEYTYSRVKTTYAETSAEGATTKTYSVTTVTENLTNGEWVAASDSKTEAYTPKEGETVNTKDPSYAYTKTTTYLTKSNKDITSSVDSSYKFVANNGKAAEGTSPAVAATEEYNYKEEHAVWTKTTTGSGESAKTTYSYHTETSTYDFTNNKWGDAVKSAESEAQDTAPTGVTFKENETTASTASVYTQIVHKLPSSASYKPTTDDTFVASNEVSEKVLDTVMTTVTYKNGNLVGSEGFTKLKSKDYNNIDLLSQNYEIKGDSKGNFNGTWMNEFSTSTTGVDKFNMGTGSDKITFSGYYGDDTVVTNKGEKLNLVFDDASKVDYDIKGNDVVLTTKSQLSYYATVKFDHDYIYDSRSTETNGIISIVNKLDSATYVDKDNNTIDLATYKALSKKQQANYTYKEGTLKLEIIDWSNGKKYFGTNDLYKFDDQTVKFSLDSTEIKGVNSDDDFYYDQEKQYVKLSDFKVYEVYADDKVVDVTSAYMTAIKDVTDGGDAVNKEYLNHMADSTVKLTNYAKADNGSVVTVGSEKLADHNYDVAMAAGKTSYKGTWLNENIVAGKEAESFAMGSGKDSITIDASDAFGEKTVTLSEKEDLTINVKATDVKAKDFANNRYFTKVVGNDLVISIYNASGWQNDSEDPKKSTKLGSIKIKNWAKTNSDVKALNLVATLQDSTVTFDLLNEKKGDVANPTVIYNSTNGNIDKNATSLTTSRLSDYIDLTGTKVTKVNSGAGNDTVVSNELNNKLNLGTGSNKIVFGTNFGKDEVTVNNGETLDLDFATGATLAFSTNGKDLIVSADATGKNTVTVKNFVGKATGAKLTIDGNDIYNVAAFKALTTYKANDAVKGKIKGSALNDNINASDYISANGVKGLTINSGSGNDKVVGTNYNDTVKASSLVGQSATVTENGGTNKVTFGKGNDVFTAGGYSSNTVNMGVGNNKAFLASDGVNKLTVGNGANEVTVSAGYNTIKAGNGGNKITLSDGINKVTTGKGKETFTISSGNNTINAGAGEVVANITNAGYNVITAKNGKNQAGTFNLGGTGYTKVTSGAGADTYTINANGTNVINSGAGADKFIISNGTNIITAKSGKKEVDTFNITGGNNVITSGSGADVFNITGGTSVINGGAGNDVYKVAATAYGNVDIADTKGANELVFSSITTGSKGDVKVYFDVEVGKKGKAVYSEMVFSKTATTTTFDVAGVDVLNKKSISKLTYAGATYDIKASELDKLAADVAGWLSNKGYASTDEVFATPKTTDDIATLVAKYDTFATNGYQMPTAQS